MLNWFELVSCISATLAPACPRVAAWPGTPCTVLRSLPTPCHPAGEAVHSAVQKYQTAVYQWPSDQSPCSGYTGMDKSTIIRWRKVRVHK